MKSVTTIFLIAGTMFFMGCDGPGKDSVKLAHEKNLNSAIDEEISEFVTEAANCRMANIEKGKLAITKSTSPAIRQYAQKLVSQQSQMLQELRMLAAQKNLALPSTISNESADDIEDLTSAESSEFDETFLDKLKKTYKRDVDAFDDATDLKDQDVKRFAESYLPAVEAEFKTIKILEDQMEDNPTAEEKDQDQASR